MLTMPWVLHKWVSFRVEPPTNSLCHMLFLLWYMLSTFRFLMWLTCSPVRAQPHWKVLYLEEPWSWLLSTILGHIRWVLCSCCISSPGSVKVYGIVCHRSIQTSYSSETSLDYGFLAFHSLQHTGRHSSLVSHHKRPLMDVSVGWIPKGLPSLLLTFSLLKDVCSPDKGFLSQVIRWW